MAQSISSGPRVPRSGVSRGSGFLADLHRAAKRVRQAHSPTATASPSSRAKGEATATATLAQEIGQAAVDVLERSLRGMGDLPREVGLYWLNTSHMDECTGDNGISDKAIDRLCAMHEFLTGGVPEDLSADDWAELAGMVEDAAEELDIDTLTQMMGTLLDKGVLG